MSKLALIIFYLALFERTFGDDFQSCYLYKSGWCVFEKVVISGHEKIIFGVNNSIVDNVKNVKFEMSTVYRIPEELFDTFPNIQHLRMIDQLVDDLKPYTFLNARNLTKLNLSFSYLLNLKPNIFRGAGNMRELYMCCGRLFRISSDSFNGLTKLEMLLLNGNDLKNLHEDTFLPLVNLRILNLNSNLLEFLHKDLFGNNLKLDTIYLNNNRISSMSNTMFRDLKNLKHLYLMGNICVDEDYPPHGQNHPTAYMEMFNIENDLRECIRTYMDAINGD